VGVEAGIEVTVSSEHAARILMSIKIKITRSCILALMSVILSKVHSRYVYGI